ncbi:MAG: hypothetical protein COT16_01735 [Elusimicrobia bacterium CG08_land_8_20_14_0_20_44_26]|nr:MAG: hypothetical protein COT16_01735 [Elusimicrobia bacterium CG08_land_8_20_14_0_20_44_26]
MRKAVLFFAAFVCWILLILPAEAQSVFLGVLVSLLTAFIFGNFFAEKPAKFLQLERWAWFIYYIPVFLYYMIRANFDVLYRVLHPALPIKPGIVKVKTRLKSPAARAALCNSITLTPGTLTVDIADEFLYIHWINVKSVETDKATKLIVERFENILERIFE